MFLVWESNEVSFNKEKNVSLTSNYGVRFAHEEVCYFTCADINSHLHNRGSRMQIQLLRVAREAAREKQNKGEAKNGT